MLKQSTNRNLAVFMTDSTDHVTGKTGLTLTITASKDGAAFASITPTVTELATGWYNLALTTTHTNTLGDFLLHITSTGADPSDIREQVVLDLPGVAQTGDNFARLGAPAGASVSADVAAVKAVLPAALVSGRIDASVGAMASGVLTATAIAADAITAAKVADGTIDAATFAAGAINAAAIAADAITAAKVADGTIDAATFAAGAINAAAIAADAITDAKVAADVTIASVTGSVGSVTGAVASVTGNVGGNVTGSVGSVATGGIAAASFAAGAINAAAVATDAIDADALAADAVTEIQSGLSTLNAAGVRTAVGLATANLDTQLSGIDTDVLTRLATSGYTAPLSAAGTRTAVGLASANLDTQLGAIDDFVDTEVGAIKTVTDRLDTALEADGGVYRFTTNALEQAPTGGTAPTASDIADEVETRTIAAVTVVNGLAANTVTAAALATDAVTEIVSATWAKVIETGYTAEQVLRILSAVAAGKTTIVQLSPGALVTYRDLNDTTDRLVAECTSGPAERVDVTLTP